MVITQPTVDDFSDTTVMRVIRKIVNYICSDSGLVAQINDNDITGFTSSYIDNVLKIDATKGDGSTLPVCNVTIEGGSSTGNPYPTAVSGTVGADGNITFTITMSSGSPLTTTIDMNYFASTADLSNLQKQVTGIKPIVTTNLESSPPTITVAVNGTSSTANLPSPTISFTPKKFRAPSLINSSAFYELLEDIQTYKGSLFGIAINITSPTESHVTAFGVATDDAFRTTDLNPDARIVAVMGGLNDTFESGRACFAIGFSTLATSSLNIYYSPGNSPGTIERRALKWTDSGSITWIIL